MHRPDFQLTKKPFSRPGSARGSAAACALGLALVAAPAFASDPVYQPRPLAELVLAVPPLPPTDVFPIQLVLDDDSAEGAVGATSGQSAKQFLWFNQFTAPTTFHLEEIWVLFPLDPQIVPGTLIQLVVFEDADGDPTNGATRLDSFNSTVQAADGNTFSIYPLPAPLTISSGRDVYLGVIPRYIVSGVTPFTFPAAIDGSSDLGRSWIAIWNADPPDPPTLPADGITSPISAFQAGNWMIRGFGTGAPVQEIPALGGVGLALLAALLGAFSVLRVRRRGATAAAPPAEWGEVDR